MELKLNDKTLRKILIGIAVAAVIILIVNGLIRRSKYSYPPSSTSTNTTDTTLRTDLTACETAYSTAYIAANGNAAAIATARTTLGTCVTGKVSAYVQTKCPYTNGEEPGTTNGGPATTATTAAWNAYQANIRSIRMAYSAYILVPTDSTNPNLRDVDVQAARKADLTGATRKYLATVCPATTSPGFYTPSDYGVVTTTDAAGVSTMSQTTVTYPDPVSTKYAQWNVYTTAPGTTPTYGFYAAAVTRTSIAAWAIGAGMLTSSDPNQEPSVPTAGLLGTGSKYSSVANGIPNWVIARDFGPGTVGKAVPISYASPTGTTVMKAEVNLPYTYAA